LTASQKAVYLKRNETLKLKLIPLKIQILQAFHNVIIVSKGFECKAMVVNNIKRNSLLRSMTPYFFVAPLVIFFGVFMAYPVIFAITISFFDWQGINVAPTETFIGLKNFIRLFSDKYFLFALRNTIWFVIATVLLQNLYGYFLALLIHLGKFKLSTLFRAIIFFPTLLAVVIVALVWRQILTIDGIVNFILNNMGIGNINWLADWKIAMWVIIFVNIWQWGGYNMVIFYAGLQSVEPQLLEAAMIDGAGLLNIITRVITPVMRPTIIIAATLTALGGFKVFDLIYVLTRSGPAQTTTVVTTYVYWLAFAPEGQTRFSYSSSVVTIFFVVIFLISFFRIRFANRKG
jgi:ABC-type sugar transport system permease subunit